MSCRQKVMDNIKSYKKRDLERVEACSNLALAEALLQGQTNQATLLKFFADRFNAINFLFCWYYMEHYVDVDASTDLGKYYMLSKFLFV